MWMKALFALSLLAVTVSLAAATHKRPFRSIKAPIETIENYDVVIPTITYQDSNETYPKVLHVTLTTITQSFSLILEKNEMLLPSGFVSRYDDEDGRETTTKGHDNCYYQGQVADQPDWIVTMTTCHGLQGEFGDPDSEEKIYNIEPLDKQEKSLNRLHALYLDSEYKVNRGGSCGCNFSFSEGRQGTDAPKLEDIKHEIERRETADNRTLYLELVIVNDFQQYTAFRRDLESTVRRAISVANRVDKLYQPLGIRVILTETITWTHGDRVNVTSDSGILLRKMESYRDQITTDHDALIMLTGVQFLYGVLGIASLGTMCSLSTGLTQDGGSSLSVTSLITAHELGHLLNMEHDDSFFRPVSEGCQCDDPTGTCIMNSFLADEESSQWSDCSVSDLKRGFSWFHVDRCLFNEPTTTVGDPVCGNGIREGDEVCDCGSTQECTDPCCNPRTCQLANGAECRTGWCCSETCQIQPFGTTCRAAVGVCGICTGESNECPTEENQIERTTCDECNFNNGGCDHVCTNTNGSFQCSCNSGFELGSDGMICIDVDECRQFDSKGGCDQRCINTYGSFECSCFFGTTLDSDGLTCNDVNECERENGYCEQICTNLDGSFECSCRAGYTSCNSLCNDVDECSIFNGGCEHVCTNIGGSFKCSCNSGYRLDSDGRTCDDVNECSSNNGGCEQQCLNTEGSFECACRSGFDLDSDGRSCSDIDECSTGSDNCEQTCTNTEGSFQCGCNNGYVLESDGRTCKLLGVKFSLKGKDYFNNSVIPLTEVGEGDDALLCITDKEACCNVAPNRLGEFYYPNGKQVLNRAAGDGFFRGRGPQLVRLSRRSGVTSPRGVFRCDVPDKDGVTQKIYIQLV